jgi:DNA-binding MarR family transcriptional regulator
MAAKPELTEVLVDMIVDYLDFIASSETLRKNEQAGRLTSNELRVMNHVYLQFRRQEQCNLSYLVEKTGISRATVSRILTSLFEYGLVREEADGNDRRVRYLYPTEVGEQSMARVSAWLQSWVEKVSDATRERGDG